MKAQFYKTKIILRLTAFLAIIFAPNIVEAQMCTDPTNIIYGLNSNGNIASINVNTAAITSTITDPGAPATTTANGMGYNNVNGKFYYFRQSNASGHQFVSYDPATATYTTLATSTVTVNASNKIRSGCVTPNGTGYYCIETLSATDVRLHYYNIVANTWTIIATNNYKEGGTGTDYTSTLNTLNSGDIAFDANGNLWLMPSKGGTGWALFKIPSPVPTVATNPINLQQIIAQTALPVSAAAFTGLAFSPTGTMYISTGAGDNKLYQLTSMSASSLTLIGTIPTDAAGADLTSCSYPLSVLPTVWLNFTASLKKDIELVWTVQEDPNTSDYTVEYSVDGQSWKPIASIKKNTSLSSTYNYTHYQYGSGNNYYRIVENNVTGKKNYSAVKLINLQHTPKIFMGPNPVADVINIYNKSNNAKYNAQVFDLNGRILVSAIISQSNQTINVAALQKGSYILKLKPATSGDITTYQFIKQ